MQQLHRHTPSRASAPPAGLVATTVRFGDQLEASRSEWFLPGTGQQQFAINSIAASGHPTLENGQKDLKNTRSEPPRASRITAPADGTIVALDPDIPPEHQRLRFTADGPGARWLLDGKPLAGATSASWLPWPGRHRVTLVNAAGEPLDEIRLEVRGAGVRRVAQK